MTVKVVFTGEDQPGKQDYNDTETREVKYAVAPSGALYIVSGSPRAHEAAGDHHVTEVYGPAAWHSVRGHRLDLTTLNKILG